MTYKELNRIRTENKAVALDIYDSMSKRTS